MSSFLSSPGTFLASSLFLEESLERARTAQATRAQTNDGKPRRGACDQAPWTRIGRSGGSKRVSSLTSSRND